MLGNVRKYKTKRERKKERDRQSDRQTDRQTKRDRERDRESIKHGKRPRNNSEWKRRTRKNETEKYWGGKRRVAGGLLPLKVSEKREKKLSQMMFVDGLLAKEKASGGNGKWAICD